MDQGRKSRACVITVQNVWSRTVHGYVVAIGSDGEACRGNPKLERANAAGTRTCVRNASPPVQAKNATQAYNGNPEPGHCISAGPLVHSTAHTVAAATV